MGFVSTNPAGAFGSPDAVFDGVNSLYLTPHLDPTVQIAQSLATTPGARYTLSFYADD